MSFDIFLQTFRGGDATDDDLAPLLADYAVDHDTNGFRRLVTADGAADVYGDLVGGLMVNHAAGRAIWDVLYEIALKGRLVLMAGGVTVVADSTLIADLPEDFPGPVQVASSGDDVLRFVTGREAS